MRFALPALLALTALRLAVAGLAPLSPDEAYYWIWSRALAGDYYDHPPMVALWVRAGTLLCGDTALGVRLLAPLSTALGSVLLARAGAVLAGDAARGVMAAALLNATLAFGVGAVTMTPDTPLLFFWVCAIWALARFIASGKGVWLLAVGGFAGLALASKFTAVFLGAGVALWLLAVPTQRRWLATPWPWLAGAVALAAFAPELAWNLAHDWAGFSRQGGRLAGFHPGNAPYFLAEFVAGQAGMLTPLVFLLCCAGVWTLGRRGWAARDPTIVLLLLLTVMPLPVFAEHVLTDRVQANWPAIVYPTAVLLGVMVWPRLHRPALALGCLLTAPVYLQAVWPVLPVPPKLDPSLKRLAGWRGLARQVEAARVAQGARFVAADNYAVAAMLAWHMKAGVPVLGAHPRWASFSLPHPDLSGQNGLLVRSGRPPVEGSEGWVFDDPADIGGAERRRGKVTAEAFRLYRVPGHGADARVVALPHPERGKDPSGDGG